MLEIHEFSVGSLADAKPLALVLSRGATFFGQLVK